LKESKEYGELVASQLKDSNGDPIFFQKVTVRDKQGNVLRVGERQILQNGCQPARSLIFDSRGIV
jgi:hypothetical protein